MGRPKMLLSWKDRTVISHIVRQWEELAADQIAIVIDPANTGISEALKNVPGISTILNPQPERGMFSSIQTAAHWNQWRNEVTRFVISLGDQPHVRLETLSALLQSDPSEVVQPSFRGRARHPVILPRNDFLKLAESAAGTFKEFLAGKKIKMIELNDPGLELDIDTPADYEAAKLLS